MMPHALDLPKSLDQAALINRYVPLITQEGRPLLIAVEDPNRLIPFRRPKFIARVPIGKEIRVENQSDGRPMRLDVEMAEVPILHNAGIIGASAKRSVMDEVRQGQ